MSASTVDAHAVPGRGALVFRTRERGLLVGAVGLGVIGLAAVHLALYAAEPWRPVAIGGVALAGFLIVHAALCAAGSAADEVMLPVAAGLSAIGLVMIYRLRPEYLVRQAAWIALGLTALLLTIGVLRDLRWVRRYTYLCAALGLVLLAVTVVAGVERNGARQWLLLGGVAVEPGEIVKLLLVAFFAGVLTETRGTLMLPGPRRWRVELGRLGPMLACCLGALLLLVFQRDLGLAMLYYGIFIAMLYVATGRADYALLGLAAFVSGAALCYHWFGHVRLRVDVWVNPWADASGGGYQILQGLYALATGGIVGTGLGAGHPTLMPASYTDMIFPAVGEELGAVGTFCVVALYLVLVGRMFRTAVLAGGTFEALMAVGLATALGLQTFIILAGSTRLIPLTGIPAPFLTYGGSAAVSNFIALALLLGVSARAVERRRDVEALRGAADR
ncbi:MAG TPA: FtsW/RodA/SpoVE family cell cycle protein [bacterium]|nr:FtsW/RodA/SpoVE family cell cycle protein [bacterium]